MDSFITILLSLCFSLLFASSALHKLRDLPTFAAIVADYRLISSSASVPLAWACALFELALCIGWLIPALTQEAAFSTAILLAGYTGAISLNLLRGRVHISCGCGGSSDQLLSWHLVARNSVLILAALACLVPFTPRVLPVYEWIAVGAATSALTLLYLAYAKIRSNAVAIELWVGKDD